MKVACTVWSRGKGGDNFKSLPIAIIKMVLQNINENKSVKKIATENNISEGQLRDWIRKYKFSGEGVLEDNRGLKKDESQLSNEEILKKRNKELEDKNRRLEAELLLIKKLRILEGGVI